MDERAEHVTQIVCGDGALLGRAVELPSNGPLGFLDCTGTTGIGDVAPEAERRSRQPVAGVWPVVTNN